MSTRELLSKLAKKLAGFDDDTIEAWIVLLREEIRALGGYYSETKEYNRLSTTRGRIK